MKKKSKPKHVIYFKPEVFRPMGWFRKIVWRTRRYFMKSAVITIDMHDPENPVDPVQFINTCERLDLTPGELVAWIMEHVESVKPT